MMPAPYKGFGKDHMCVHTYTHTITLYVDRESTCNDKAHGQNLTAESG